MIRGVAVGRTDSVDFGALRALEARDDRLAWSDFTASAAASALGAAFGSAGLPLSGRALFAARTPAWPEASGSPCALASAPWETEVIEAAVPAGGCRSSRPTT